MKQSHRKALHVLYNLAQNDEHADVVGLARRLGVSCVSADAILAALEAEGLVDADRVRLTMAGLVVAVSTDARRAQRPHDAGPHRSASRAA